MLRNSFWLAGPCGTPDCTQAKALPLCYLSGPCPLFKSFHGIEYYHFKGLWRKNWYKNNVNFTHSTSLYKLILYIRRGKIDENLTMIHYITLDRDHCLYMPCIICYIYHMTIFRCSCICASSLLAWEFLSHSSWQAAQLGCNDYRVRHHFKVSLHSTCRKIVCGEPDCCELITIFMKYSCNFQ